MHVLCLQVAIAPLDFLCARVVEQPQAATAKRILTVQPSSASVQRVFSLDNSGFTYQQGLSLQDYTYITSISKNFEFKNIVRIYATKSTATSIVKLLKCTHSVVELGFVSAARFNAFISDSLLSLISA